MSTIATLVVAGRADPTGVQRGIAAMVASVERFAERVRSVGRTLNTYLTLPTLAAAGATIKLASDAGESASKLQAVMGAATDRVNTSLQEFRKTIPETTARLQDFTSDFYSLLQPMGVVPEKATEMSLQLVRLAADISSFRNERIEDVFLAIRSGLVGENEAVRRFGVSMNSARLASVAMSQGLYSGTGIMSSAAKATAAFNIILHDTALAHGDAARTAGSAANQFKFFGAGIRQIATVIGQQFLPMITPAVVAINQWLERIQSISPETLRMAIAIAAVIAAIGPLLIIIGSVISAMANIVGVFAAFSALSAGPMIGALLAIVGAFLALRAVVGSVSGSVQNSRESLAGLVPPVSALASTLANATRIASIFAAILVGRLVGALIAAVAAMFAKLVAARAMALEEVRTTAATLAAARAQTVATGAFVQGALVQMRMARTVTAATGSMAGQRAAAIQLAGAQTAHMVATRAATAAEEAHIVALAGVSIGARIAATSVGALKGALAFFGGPIGLAITIALTAISFAFVNAGQKAREAAADARMAAEEFKAALLTMDEATLGAKFFTTTQQVAGLVGQVGELERVIARQRAQGPLTQEIIVDRGIRQVVNTELGNMVAHNERSLAQLRTLRNAAQTEQQSISDELHKRQELQRQLADTTGALVVPDLPTTTFEKPKSAADALRNSVQAVVTRLEYVRARGEDTTVPLREAARLNESILAQIQAQGGALRANTDLLEAASTLSRSINDTSGMRDRVQDISTRLEIAFATGRGVNETLGVAQALYAQVNAEVERQGGILKANTETLQMASTLQNVIARQSTVVTTRAGAMLQRFQALQQLGTDAWTGMLGQITAVRSEVQSAIDAQGGIQIANTELVQTLLQLNEAIDQIDVKVRPPRVEVSPIQLGEVTLTRVFEALEKRSETLIESLSEAQLGFTRMGFSMAFANLRLDLLADYIDAIRSVSPATITENIARAGYEVSKQFLALIDPISMIGDMFSEVGALGQNLLESMNPLSIIFDAISDGLRKGLGDSLDKLAPLIETIATAFGEVLGPVIEALAPVIEALAPLVISVAKVFAALFIAITPILKAMVPLLGAFFPIFKMVAIAATYVGQIFFTVAEGLLRVIAFFVDAVGTVIRALGKIINAITPFANPGNPLIRAGEWLQGFAKGLRSTADGFGEAVDALGKAREEIKAIVWDESINKVDKLGEAAQTASESIFNLPNAYKLLNYRRFQTMDALTNSPAMGATRTSAAGNYITSSSATTSNVTTNNFNIRMDARDRTPAELFDMVRAEGKRRARAETGDESRWSEVVA